MTSKTLKTSCYSSPSESEKETSDDQLNTTTISSQNDEPLSPTPTLFHKFASSLQKTTKTDKYVRLVCNVLKIVRSRSPLLKDKYSKIYKQLLVLRQVIRWNGMYETLQGWAQQGAGKLFSKGNLFDFLFEAFGVFGDLLDRGILMLELFPVKKLQKFKSQIEQVQSDCYFIQCVIWLALNLKGLYKLREQNWSHKDKKMKLMKSMKYAIDCLTSYSKMRFRSWELQLLTSGILGTISSILGIMSILQ